MKISLEYGYLIVAGRNGRAVSFAHIVEVAAEKVGKVTYDEVFLIIREKSDETISLGELDDGFADAEQALRSHLPGFPSDWWTAAEQAPVGIRAQVWSTSA